MRRKIIKKKRKQLASVVKGLILILILAFVVVVISLFRPKYWDIKGKLAVVSLLDADTVLSVYDIKKGTVDKIIIPGETQVQAAKQFGTWKLLSLWKLGKDENMGGSLVVKTIARNFYFPVYLSYEDLTLGDRLRIEMFEIGKKSQTTVTNLRKNNFLKATVFLDGEKGFLIPKNIPQEISSLFSDQDLFGTEGLPKASIVDSSGSYGLSEKVGKIIETMGIKVAVISQNTKIKGVCTVSGGNEDIVKKVSFIFGCNINKDNNLTKFDLVINLGEEFSYNF